MEIKTTEFFRNMKSLPPEGTNEFQQLIDWEVEKITGGITVNGVFISGWLYWHINHWWIRVDDLDEYKNIIRKPQLPELRDNEWIRAEYLEQCKHHKDGAKGYMEVGGRQSGKSEMEASYFGMNSTIFENTQNLIVCGNDDDLSLLKDKVDFGMKHLWKGIAIPRLDKTWRLNQIRLGYKNVQGEDQIWSYIIIRNAQEGRKTEAGAGTTAKTVIFDEVGKYLFASSFAAVEPAIKSQFGWRTVPILVGTGGSFDNGKDAENLFYNPDANNFLSVENPDTHTKTAIFLSGLYRLDCKEPKLLGDWLRERGINVEDVSELNKITIAVSNKEKANKLIETELEAAKHNPDRTLFLKKKMYYPRTVDECFLRETQNIFDIEAAKRQKFRLNEQGRTGTPVILVHDGEKIVHEFTDKQAITNFPLRPNDSKDAPVIIYEFPVENPPYGLYTAGCLLPGEKVNTEKGLQNVEDITLLNRLISKDGKLVNIHNLQRYYKENEDVYKIKLSNLQRTTSFTKEHPVYVSNAYGNNGTPIIEDRFRFEFLEIKNIREGQWIKTPNIYRDKNNFDTDVLWDNVATRIDRQFSSPLKHKDFWWFVGLFLGDGWCESNNYKISISFNIKEKLHFDRFVCLVKNLFGRETSYRTRKNCIEASFSCKQLHTFLSTNFGKFASDKYISEWIKRIDDELKYELLLGYLDSDGCVTHDKKRNYYGLDFVSINLRLMEDVQDIFFSLGYVSAVNVLREEDKHYFHNKIKKSKTQKTYQLRVGHNFTIEFAKHFVLSISHKLNKIDLYNIKETTASPKKGCFLSKDKKYIYFKITKLEKSIYTGWVYNFECETHTYMCSKVTTHNCDPYRQGQAAYSSSLGSIYIYKRMHDIVSEKFQDMFVASYCARPEKKETWEEQARLLIKYYNARTLCENDDISFIEYMKAKGDARYLERQPEWLKEIVPNTTVHRDYGVHRSAQKIIDFLHNVLKSYLEEVVYTEKDDKGVITKEILGVSTVFDPVLLEEIIQYNDDGNFDRIIAAELAIAQAIKMDPIVGRISGSGDPRVLSMKRKVANPLFLPARTIMKGHQRKLFT